MFREHDPSHLRETMAPCITRAPALLTEHERETVRDWLRDILGEFPTFVDPMEEEAFLHAWKMQLLAHHPD